MRVSKASCRPVLLLAGGVVLGCTSVDSVDPIDTESDWPLGTPDAVVAFSEPVTIGPHDRDAFRNLVLAPAFPETRYVRTVDIRPGPAGNVHHAVLKIDPTEDSRRRAAADAEPGFDGMDMGLSTPPQGHFLVWTPGMEPKAGSDRSAWVLPAGSDLVLQLHLPASDTAVEVSPVIGLYFSATPPSDILEQVFLNSMEIDIAPGDDDYIVSDAMELPVAVEVLSAFPHAHYLARAMHVTATLPDGSIDSLLTIDDWQFGKQLEYQFAEPRRLPAGTRVTMRYRYDNSAANPQNPSSPPERVRMGMGSTDEMASLRLQVRMASEEDRLRLAEAQVRHAMEDAPDHPELNYELGTTLLHQGRLDEAISYLERATEQRPAFPWAWNNLGVALAQAGRLDEAVMAWQRVLELEPDHVEVYNNLGNVYLARNDPATAVRYYRQAVGLSPGSAILQRNLAAGLAQAGEREEAIAAYERAVRIDPRRGDWQEELAALRRAQ